MCFSTLYTMKNNQCNQANPSNQYPINQFNVHANNLFTINRNQPIVSPAISVTKHPDHHISHHMIQGQSSLNNTNISHPIQPNNSVNHGPPNNSINMKPGESVYDSNGNVIGILNEAMNVITNNGKLNILRPVTFKNLPPIVNYNYISGQNNLNISALKQDKSVQRNQISYPDQTNAVSANEGKIVATQIKTITRETMKRGRHIPSALKPFICKICGKGYKYLCNYRSHSKIHTDKAFVCDFCGKRFGRKSNYNEHLRIHTGEAPYVCEVCNKTFKQHHGWKDHLRVHTGEKPYLCNICGKRFTVGHNLNVHMRIHTGERPYLCQICKKTYRQKSAYNSHIKHVHGIKK